MRNTVAVALVGFALYLLVFGRLSKYLALISGKGAA